MFKRFLALLLTAALLTALTPVVPLAAPAPTALSPDAPAIPATVGETVRLGDYTYEGVSLADFTLKPVNGAAITGGAFTPKEPGVAAFDAVKGDKALRFCIVAKNKEDKDYVLFERSTFDSPADIADLRPIPDSSVVSVENGCLKLSGASGRLLLPDTCGPQGNVKIEVRARLDKPLNSSRWMSVMHRVQNTGDEDPRPYFQMAVRANPQASNGVELAFRTSSNAWNVRATGSFFEGFAPDKFYDFKVETYGDRIVESINNQVILDESGRNELLSGGIGLQVDNCTMLVESIKVSLLTSPIPAPKPLPGFAQVRPFAPELAAAPSVVSFVNTKEELESLGTLSPATAFFRINNAGDITAADGSKIASLEEALQAAGDTVIPGFVPEGEAAADAVTAYCRQHKIEDVTLLSADADLLAHARQAYFSLRTILRLSAVENTPEGIGKIRQAANTCGARAVMLPYGSLDKAGVQHLQKLLISVIMEAPEQETEAAAVTRILTGANGITAQNRELTGRCFKTYFAPGTLLRRPFIIGHRGIPAMAPENSTEGMVRAFEHGADIVETDIYLSADGEVVLMHDRSVDRTSNGSGPIEALTYSQLQRMELDAVGGLTGCRIPRLQDYLQACAELPGSPQIFIEIKSADPAIIPKAVEAVRQTGTVNRVSFISFDLDQLARVRELAPEISVGALCSGINRKSKPMDSLRKAATLVQFNRTTFNHSLNGATEEYLEQLGHRFISYWSWTYDSDDLLHKHYFSGFNGLTADNAAWIEAQPKEIRLGQLPGSVKEGTAFTLAPTVLTGDGQEAPLGDRAELVPVCGATAKGLTLTATGGDITGYCRMKASYNGTDYYTCSDVFTIPVTKAGLGTGTWILIGSTAALAVIAILAVTLVLRREKRDGSNAPSSTAPAEAEPTEEQPKNDEDK